MSTWLTAPLALITYYHRDADPSRKCVFTKAMLTRVQILVYRHFIDIQQWNCNRKPIDKSILCYLFMVFLSALFSFSFFLWWKL